MAGFYEFYSLKDAEKRHSQLSRLGYRPFSIFKTSRGTWGFHIG